MVHNVGQFFAPKAMTAGTYYGPEGGRGRFESMSGGKFRGALSKIPTLYDLDAEMVRLRARKCYFESPQARALVKRLVDFTIGNGLTYQAAPVWELIDGPGDPSEAAQKKRYRTKRDLDLRFAMWAGSHEPDATDAASLYELQYGEMEDLLVDGETFTVLRYSDDPARMSPVSLQRYRPEQIISPRQAQSTGVTIVDGIELDASGKTVAIWVSDDGLAAPVRFPVASPTGRRFVIHHKLPGPPGQVRGVSMLAPYVHEFQKMDDARLAELEAMILNALFALWVEPGADAKGTDLLDKMAGRGAKDNTATANGSQLKVEMRGAQVAPPLKPGEKFHSFETSRPNLNVQAFSRGIGKGITAAEGVGIEVAELEFNTAYTAARAAVLAMQTKIDIYRDAIASQWLIYILEAWFVAEIAASRIKAKGFGDSPLVRRAWLQCTWLGAAMMSLDPMKEVTAVELRTKLGHTTGQREAMKYNNSDFEENVRQQKGENERLAEAREPLDGAGVADATPDTELDENGNPIENDGVPGESKGEDPAQLKLVFDAYGVGVRAGIITPQPEDEDSFRTRANLPKMTSATRKNWSKEGDVRRPITLTPMPEQEKASGFGSTAPANEDADTEDPDTPDEGA